MDSDESKALVVTATRGVLAGVPFIGGMLVEVFFEHRSRLKQRRLETFLADLGAQVTKSDLNESFATMLKQDRFADLLEAAVGRALRTGDANKHARLRQVLLNGVVATSAVDVNELFLDLAAELQEKQMEILAAFRTAYYEAESRAKEDKTLPLQGPFRTAEAYGLSHEQFRVLVLHLVSRGLLYDDGVGRWSTGALQVIAISDLGLEFLKYVESPDAEQNRIMVPGP